MVLGTDQWTQSLLPRVPVSLGDRKVKRCQWAGSPLFKVKATTPLRTEGRSLPPGSPPSAAVPREPSPRAPQRPSAALVVITCGLSHSGSEWF